MFLFRRFLLIRVLGRGASGTVWLARDADLELEVALKLIGESSVRDEVAAEQLREETRLCLRLSHPHIVRIHSFHQEGPRAAISMELVKGETLHSWRSSHSKRRLSPAELERPVRQLISAMHYAHERVGVLHLDLKPTNLMMDEQGDLRVLDFGIGRARVATIAERFPGSGSADYMSPQRRRSQPATVSDDLYSAGVLLHEFLTGVVPEEVAGNDHPRMRINDRLRSLGAPEDEVPKVWEEAVAACLEEDPRNRPASFGELGSMLGFADDLNEAGFGKVAAPPEQENFSGLSVRSFAVTRRVPPTLERWGGRSEGRPCWETALDYADAAYRLLAAGEALTSYEIIRDGLRWFPEDAGLGRLLGTALIRLGRPGEARQVLEAQRPARVDAEFSAVMGKAMLHEALTLGGEEEERLAEGALSELEAAAAGSPDLLVPMEAMVAATLLGAKTRARAFAQAVTMRVEQEKAGWFEPSPGRFPEGWRPFAAGLGALVSGDSTHAAACFDESRRGWGGALHDLAEARRLLSAVAGRVGLTEDEMEQFLPMPGVGIAVGHMFDRPDRPSPRFPRSREEEVRRRLAAFVEGEGIGCGFASGACGTDILFHEVLHFRGLPSTLVLPLPLSEPRQLGGIVHGTEDEERLLRVADSCVSVVSTSRFDSGDDEVESAYCLACLLGLAGLHAATLGAKLHPLAIWDGRVGDRRGGTADMVAYWRSLGLTVEVVALGDGIEGGVPDGFAELPEKIRSTLVIRAPGYTSWPDAALAEFGECVLPEVLHVLGGVMGTEVQIETDGSVTAIFGRPEDAATAAFGVAGRLENLTGRSHPEVGQLRYAIHAGPLERSSSGVPYGSHLNLARSIATPSAHLYGTENFAALLHLSAPGAFVFRYTGQSWLASGFGPRPLYEICPKPKLA